MTLIAKDELRRQLKGRELSPVYFLFGDESYLRDIAARKIADLALSDSQLREFNETELSLLSGGSEALANGLAAADQLPMMSERRVIRIRDVKITSTGAKETLKEESIPVLERYLDNPSPSTVLILLGDEVDPLSLVAKYCNCTVYIYVVDLFIVGDIVATENNSWTATDKL